MSMDAGQRELLAKYHDWCSARIADQFLSLSPEMIYELAQASGSTPAAAASSAPAPELPLRLPEAGAASYRALVQRVTEVLLEEMDLPSYEEWVEVYRADPDGFEEEMLGFWRGGPREDG